LFTKTLSDLERELGLKYYLTNVPPIGGKIRLHYEDFIVEEVLRDGTVISADSRKKVRIPIGGEGDYVRAILVKRGCDTLSAIYLLARTCNVPLHAISYLGLKDARAVSAQLISIKNCEVPLMRFEDKRKRVAITQYVRSPFPVKRHELYGNVFTITIRRIPLPPEEISSRLNEFLRQVRSFGGLPAYFGHQRFGTIKPVSHKVGKALLLNDFEGAVKHILTNSQDDFLRKRRGITAKALNYEVLIINHLLKKRGDFAGALRKVPTILLRLFIHAYQSYLFNKMLSKRIDLGLPLNRAVIGDVVGFPKAGSIDPSRVFLVEKHNLEKINKLIEKGLMSVVLPVVGFKTKVFPKYNAAEPVLSILEEEGILRGSFAVPHSPKLKCPGTYRPTTFNFENFKIVQLSSDRDGSSKLVLRFQLRRGFYATVVLREIIKPSNVLECGF